MMCPECRDIMMGPFNARYECWKCGHTTMDPFDAECEYCTCYLSPSADITYRLGGVFVLPFVLFFFCLLIQEASFWSRAPNVPHTITVTRDNYNSYYALVLVPTGTSRETCVKLLHHIVRSKTRGRAGHIQVFDNTEAKEMAMVLRRANCGPTVDGSCSRRPYDTGRCLCGQRRVVAAYFWDNRVHMCQEGGR